MNQAADRASLLDRLVAASGDERLRALFADSPIERIASAVSDAERARKAAAAGQRLGTLWSENPFELIDDPGDQAA